MSIIEEKWYYDINLSEIESNYFTNFELEINSKFENLLKLLTDNFISQVIRNQSNSAQSYDEELKLLIEGNKELRQELDMKLKELTKQQEQYETHKKDQKLLSQEIKETHEAFLMAKKYYKKFLKTYFSIETRNKETQVVFIQFFTEAKKDTENYSVRLLRNLKTGSYQLQSTHPKLKNMKDLQEKLLDTNDVPGVLCCLRQAFLTIKANKK